MSLSLVYIVVHLKNSVKSYHGPRPAHPRTAVDHDRPLLRTHSVSECSDKSKMLISKKNILKYG